MSKTKVFNKKKVLEAAANVFRKKGFNGTSIDELSVATGISRSGLYGSFQDKHNLYLQSIEFYKSGNYEKTVEENIDGLRKTEALFKGIVNLLVNNPNYDMCLLVNVTTGTFDECCRAQQKVCNSIEDITEMLCTWLQDAQDKKLINLSKRAQVYSQFLCTALYGIRSMCQGGAGKAELNNVVKITLDSLN